MAKVSETVGKDEAEGRIAARRDFMRLAGLGTVASAVTVVAGAGEAKATTGTVEVPASRGYEETAHVKAYYATARF